MKFLDYRLSEIGELLEVTGDDDNALVQIILMEKDAKGLSYTESSKGVNSICSADPLTAFLADS